MTATDMYKAFLGRIQKKSKRSVWPEDFNRIINIAYRLWLEERTSYPEVDQRHIDDLAPLYVILDGSMDDGGSPATTFDPIPISSGGVYFPYPHDYSSDYPQVYRILRGTLVGDLGSTHDVKLSAKVLKSNLKESALFKNPYRRPYVDTTDTKRSRVYIQSTQAGIRPYTPSEFSPLKLILEYIKKPADIVYGSSPVDCELEETRCEQVVDIAARVFLEEVQSPRYQTSLAERQIEEQSNQ